MNNYNLELDLKKIEELGELREEENYKFRSFLKGRDSKRVDEIVHRLNNEISSRIDCTECGNCCKRLKPELSKTDIKRLSGKLNIPSKTFKEEYTESDGEEIYFTNLPCSFLKDNKCTVYSDRPFSCSEYPFLHKKDIIFRLYGIIDNYSICPIVFNVFERLKKEFNFR